MCAELVCRRERLVSSASSVLDHGVHDAFPSGAESTGTGKPTDSARACSLCKHRPYPTTHTTRRNAQLPTSGCVRFSFGKLHSTGAVRPLDQGRVPGDNDLLRAGVVASLRRVLSEVVMHYRTERNHQGSANRLVRPQSPEMANQVRSNAASAWRNAQLLLSGGCLRFPIEKADMTPY
jgi:hypothetical protein